MRIYLIKLILHSRLMRGFGRRVDEGLMHTDNSDNHIEPCYG